MPTMTGGKICKSYTVNNCSSAHIHIKHYLDKQYKVGSIATPYGYCQVYAQSDMWSLTFIWQGICYEMSDKCSELPSDLALTRRALKLAQNVIEVVKIF